MAKFIAEVTVEDSPDAVWRVVGDLGAISGWAPGIELSSFDGQTRTCTLPDGGQLRERLVSRDETLRRFEYSIVESPMPITRHHSSMQVEDAPGGSRVIWEVELEPDALAEPIKNSLQSSLIALKERIEGPAA